MEYDSPESVEHEIDDPFEAAAAKAKADETRGLVCETKSYEKRWNLQGQRVVLQAGSRAARRVIKEKDHDAAIVIVKSYNFDGDLTDTEIRIQSPHLKTAMKEVIKDYPGLNLDATSIIMHDEPRCFFHYRKELVQYGQTLESYEAVEHLQFALNFMYQTLEATATSWYVWAETEIGLPGLEFEHLWAAYRPGCLVYQNIDDEARLAQLEKMYVSQEHWCLSVLEMVYDGNAFGLRTSMWKICRYDGFMPFVHLQVFPLEYHPQKDQVLAEAISRGKQYVKLQDHHYLAYKGEADLHSPARDQTLHGEMDYHPFRTTKVSARIVVDTNTYAECHAAQKIRIDNKFQLKQISKDKGSQLSDTQYAICFNKVPAFSLREKCWGLFRVDRISKIIFSEDAYNSLLLPPGQKEMIFSLVKSHGCDNIGFDDIIRGKGRGMIFLLHGVPGVGKTVTAESVADYLERPLYVVGSGDLGIDVDVVEKRLQKILRLAETWKAIVLIDEADVFLQQRSAADIERNALVSVFLRVLEYYEGIMFLTTNRVKQFDEAFKSRIHMAIHYMSLDAVRRCELWKLFLSKAITGPFPPWLTTSCLERLAAEDFNGRQLKNIVRMSSALAVGAGVALEESHIRTSMDLMKQFEQVMAPTSEGRESMLKSIRDLKSARRSRKRRRLGRSTQESFREYDVVDEAIDDGDDMDDDDDDDDDDEYV